MFHKKIVLAVLWIAVLCTSPKAFADFYWKFPDGTYRRAAEFNVGFMDRHNLSSYQVDPSTVPSNVVWTQSGAWWVGQVPAASGPSPAEVYARQVEARKAEEKRRAEEKRLAEERHLAEERRKAEEKRREEERIAREHEAKKQSILEEDSGVRIARAKALAKYEAQEYQETLDNEYDQFKARIDAKVARIKAQAESFCFPEETQVRVKGDSSAGYATRAISEVRVGDSVVTCTLTVSGGTCELGEVQQVFESTATRLMTLSFAGQTLRATENHPFYVVNKDSWVSADKLEIGDLLYTISGTSVPLEQIESEDGVFKVYNLEVKDNHNYFACDVLVHNCNSLAAGTVNPTTAAGSVLGAAVLAEAVPAAVFVGSAAVAGYALHEAMKATDGEIVEGESRPDGEPAKQRNKPPAPSPEAKGTDHTIIERPGREGQYTTHNADGTWKQYRGSGQEHGSIPRPNVKETKWNTDPKTGKSHLDKGRVRTPRPDEFPSL